jgi:four helix bundle protein
MYEKIKSFRDLKIWQQGIDIVEDVYSLTKEFPREEKYSLISQMRRCSVSIPSNIAEGFRRYHNKEYKQFLYISLGSAAELETQLIISQRLSYITSLQMNPIVEDLGILGKMTTSLMRKLI